MLSRLGGVCGRFRLIECLCERSPDRTPFGSKKQMFGDAQLQWLIDALISSNAPFKIIAGENKMMNPMTPHEAFGSIPDEQKRLISFIREAKIPGVLFLSGDRHMSEFIKRDEPGFDHLYDSTPALSHRGLRIRQKEKRTTHPAFPELW